MKRKNRPYVDSLYVSRSTGDRVRIRTYLGGNSYRYAIWASDVLEHQLTQKFAVRAYIVQNDCHAVESF